MKRKLLAILFILSLLLTSCSNDYFLEGLHVGENGNLWRYNEDLGISLKGPQGEQGEKGDKGDRGEAGIPGSNGVAGPQGSKGEQGIPGEDGNTPYIGENGNWWIGNVDTGVKAEEENMDRVGTDGLLFRTTIRGGVAGYEVYSYVGTDTDIIIPNYIFDQPVVSIAQGALPTRITSLSISSNTEWLPNFKNYGYLKSFDFNSAPVETTAVDMFRGCTNLSKITNYENIKVISEYSFYETKVIDYDFSNTTYIGRYAFGYSCVDENELALGEVSRLFVYIPENVIFIGSYAFDSDFAVYYAGATCEYSATLLVKSVKHSDDGYYYVDNGDSISVVNYDGSESRIVIPEEIDGKPVTTIPDYAFYTNPYVERVELPDTATTVGYCAFLLCKQLHSLFIPDSVESVRLWETWDNDWREYGFENVTVFFEANTFDYPGGVTSPDQLGLNKYMIGVNPDDIVDDENCVYIRKTLSYEVVAIKNVAGIVTIPAYIGLLPVTRINSYAMYGDTLTTVVDISDGVKKISTKAFYSNDNLRVVNIPKSVEAANYQAFYDLDYCTVHIESETIPADWDSSWYYNISTYKLDFYGGYDSTGSYLYEIVDGNLYLVKYLLPIYTQTPIFVPEELDGMKVYGVRNRCYDVSNYYSSSEKLIFVIPSSITVMESYSIHVYRSCEVYVDFASYFDRPSGWSSSWYYIYYSEYIYYTGQWELVDNVPVKK